MHTIGCRMIQLRHLDMSWIRCSSYESELDWVAAAKQLRRVACIRALQKLVLKYCDIGGDAACALLRAVRSMPELSHVDMTGNRLQALMKTSLKEFRKEQRMRRCLNEYTLLV